MKNQFSGPKAEPQGIPRGVVLEFSYVIDEHSCLKYCIFTKLSHQIVSD